MDGDPAVEPELDSFSLTLPLPYRVALLVVLGTYHHCPPPFCPQLQYADDSKGVWAWGANLQYLNGAKIVRQISSTLPLRYLQL